MPDGWSFDDAGESVAFFDPDGVGSVNVSCHLKDCDVSHEDLEEFAAEHESTPVELAGLRGIASKGVVDESYQEHYWLRENHVLVYVTYTCATEDHGTEADSVRHLLNSITLA